VLLWPGKKEHDARAYGLDAIVSLGANPQTLFLRRQNLLNTHLID